MCILTYKYENTDAYMYSVMVSTCVTHIESVRIALHVYENEVANNKSMTRSRGLEKTNYKFMFNKIVKNFQSCLSDQQAVFAT